MKTSQTTSYIDFVSRRSRSEFWTGGNDISRGGDWVWEEGSARVEARLWLESPPVQPSLEENCLVWRLSQARDGVVEADCCSHRNYICQL